jgi:large subunit ribosomal protein L17
MLHGTKKIRFSHGKDADKMLMRKLIHNFLINGKIVSTEAKIKALKPLIDKIIEKAKEKTESNKNYLLRNVAEDKTIKSLFDEIGPVLKDKIGGYVKIIRLSHRPSDGSSMMKMEWTYPIVKK